MYKKTGTTHLGVFNVKIRHRNKDKLGRFSVGPVGSSALLGMPDIGILGIRSVKYDILESRRDTGN